MLAATYLLDTSRQQFPDQVDPASSAQLFSSLVSLQEQADNRGDLDEILSSVAQLALALTGADGAAVALVEEHSVVCRARAGTMAPTVGSPINLRSSFTGQAFRTCQVLCCDDTEADARVNRAVCRVAGIRSIVVVPIERRRQSTGVVEVFSAAPARFESAEIRSLELLAGLIADLIPAQDVIEETQVPEIPLRVIAHAEAVAPEPSMPAQATETAAPAIAPAEPEEQLLFQPPRSRAMLRAWVVFAAFALSCAAGAFLFRQRETWMKFLPRTRLAAGTALEPTLPPPRAAERPPTVSTGPGVLQDVKYNSRRDFTSVEIALSGPVQLKTEHLADPDRIYFDLAETRLAPEFIASLHMKAIAVDDRLVSRVRISQKSEDVVRVVLDLNRSSEYSYVMSDSPPFRLVVEVHAPAAGAAVAREVEKPAPAPPPVRPSNTTEPKPPLAADRRLKIVVDPGHGGWDLGSVGPTGLQEKEVVLDVAERLSKLLRDRLGAEIILTRAADTFVPLDSRSALANSTSADLFVSIHGNSSSLKNIRGVETFYVAPAAYKGSTSRDREREIMASRRLASSIQRALYRALAADPLVHDRGVKTAALSVLEAPTMPSILTEIAFITSADEEQKLRRSEYRDTIAEALFEGIKAYARATGREVNVRAGNVERAMEAPSTPTEHGSSRSLK